MDFKEAGKRIKEARKAKRLTQETLGNYAGVSKSAVSQWENGQVDSIDSAHLYHIAKALDVSQDYILSGTDQSKIEEIQNSNIQIVKDFYDLVQRGLNECDMQMMQRMVSVLKSNHYANEKKMQHA